MRFLPRWLFVKYPRLAAGTATTNQNLISASDLGRFTFCQESARHAFVGKQQSRMARSRMRRGTLTHRKWQRRKDRPTFKSLAFLASLIGLVLAIGAVVVALV